MIPTAFLKYWKVIVIAVALVAAFIYHAIALERAYDKGIAYQQNLQAKADALRADLLQAFFLALPYARIRHQINYSGGAMLDLNKYGIIGAQSLFTGKKTVVLDPAPTITTQPNSIVLFQVGGKMSFTGAAVAGASSVGWQKRNDDGSWSNTDFSSVTPDKGTATSADAGVYRLRAINGNSQPVYSNLVYAYDCFLFIQNDNESNNPATTGVLAGADRYHWKEDGPVGTRLYSAFLRFNKAQTLPSGATVAENVVLDNNAVTELGLTSGRTVATWSSSNSAVAAVSNGYVPGQTAVRLNAGVAVITAKYQNLTADIAVTIT